MTGAAARELTGQRWQLDAAVEAGPATATYRVGDDSITVALDEVSDGQGGPISPASSSPAYEPGEEYRFLGGTDAAMGERLYLTGRVPGRVRVHLIANRYVVDD